jgi:uncharacterized protein (TIGR00645 family)
MEVFGMTKDSKRGSDSEKSSLGERFEDNSEKALFGARWLLAPFYFGLTAAIALLLLKFLQQFYKFARNIFVSDVREVQLGIFGLLDLTLLANLMLIMIFAGYENFVSKIGAAEGSEDKPQWMGKVDYSGLKIKLIGSLVAISVIELLQDFVNLDHSEITSGIRWRIYLHITFVASGVFFALMDYLVSKRKQIDTLVKVEEAKLHP